MEVFPSEIPLEVKSCLDPIKKYLKFFKLIGGFPLITNNQSRISYSKYEFLKLIIHLCLVYISINIITLYGIASPSKNASLYKDIKAAAGFSTMDYAASMVITTVNSISNIINYVALKRVSQKLDKFCQDVDTFNSNHNIFATNVPIVKGKSFTIQVIFNQFPTSMQANA